MNEKDVSAVADVSFFLSLMHVQDAASPERSLRSFAGNRLHFEKRIPALVGVGKNIVCHNLILLS